MPTQNGAGDGPGPDGDWLGVASWKAGAKAAKENFPVALRMLPGRYRGYLQAVYVFARTTDDAGDLAPPGERLQLLDELADDVRGLYAMQAAAGSPDQSGTGPARGRPRIPAVRGLADVVTDCAIPMQLFLDLIGAGQQDQVVTRYQTFDELIGYCRLSANPVGRIVLHIFGCSSPRRAKLSDDICTGLQLAEHLQDVGEDMRAGRIYLPADDLRAHGCTEQDLLSSSAPPQLRRLIGFEVGRARELIDSGAPLVGTLRGAARAAVAGYVAGGRAALAAIAAADYDVLSATPRPSKGRTAAELIAALVRAR